MTYPDFTSADPKLSEVAGRDDRLFEIRNDPSADPVARTQTHLCCRIGAWFTNQLGSASKGAQAVSPVDTERKQTRENNKEAKMGRFPTREAEVATLAADIINGMTETADDYPSPPITLEELQSKLDAYWRTHEAAVQAQGVAAEAVDVKNQALSDLADDMRLVLRYAEHATKNDEVKLQKVGRDVRKTASAPHPPGPARALEIKREGPGWLYLDWKRPSEGGSVAGYHVQVTMSEAGLHDKCPKNAYRCPKNALAGSRQPH